MKLTKQKLTILINEVLAETIYIDPDGLAVDSRGALTVLRAMIDEYNGPNKDKIMSLANSDNFAFIKQAVDLVVGLDPNLKSKEKEFDDALKAVENMFSIRKTRSQYKDQEIEDMRADAVGAYSGGDSDSYYPGGKDRWLSDAQYKVNRAAMKFLSNISPNYVNFDQMVQQNQGRADTAFGKLIDKIAADISSQDPEIARLFKIAKKMGQREYSKLWWTIKDQISYSPLAASTVFKYDTN